MFLHVVGARPQFMKLAPLAQQFEKKGMDYDILHTGQHYDKNMSDDFFKELGIKKPDYLLDHNGKPYPELLSDMIEDISYHINQYTDVVVYGDTLSTLAGSLAATFSGKTLHHVESGLRLPSLQMPEERIRRMVDEVSDHLYCISESDAKNLSHVNGDVHVVGDIMYDNFLHREVSDSPFYGIIPYVFVTIHREENTHKKELTFIIEQLNQLSKTIDIVFPVHPRTQAAIDEYNISVEFPIHDTMSQLQTLQYINGCEYVISDSGGVPKEAYWMKKKSIVVLKDLVYPVLEEHNYCMRADYNKILRCVNNIDKLDTPSFMVKNLLGYGDAAHRITEIMNA